MKQIHFKASQENSSQIIIGSDLFGKSIFPQDIGDHYILVTDKIVNKLYGNEIIRVFNNSHCITIDPGEKSKSLEVATCLYNDLLELGARRRTVLVAFGGGVITDLVGFVAATFMRGIPYINIPTTLIAQADAAIGGKVAVNHAVGKNLIGAFWHPNYVLIDPVFLETLPLRHLKSGLAEIIKVSIITDPQLFNYIESNVSEILDKKIRKLEYIVYRSVRAKVKLLESDPYERELKRALNLGHTLGHPLETLYKYSSLTHGEAVSIGMYIATHVALQRELCVAKHGQRILRLLLNTSIPSALIDIVPEELWNHIQVVRRVRNNNIHFVLPVEIGRVTFVEDLSLPEIVLAINDLNAQKR